MTHTKKKLNNLNHNLRLAVFFILFVLFFASVSIAFKIFFLVKESSFDGKHNFNVELTDATNINVISFSPGDKSISVLETDPKIKTNNIGALLKLPIDARINLTAEFDSNHIPQALIKSSYVFSKKLERMTVLDALRLAFFASVRGNSLEVQKLSQESINSQTLISNFKDPAIKAEKKAIEIVNATEVFGLGSRLATLVTNIGGDVILVTTRQNEKKSKVIYYGKESYTVERLGQYLDFPIEKTQHKSVADVIIIIGENNLGSLKF